MDRVPAGRLNGIWPPIGTVLGPKQVTREFVVATAHDDRGCTVGYATPADLEAIKERDPQSLTEWLAVRPTHRTVRFWADQVGAVKR